jgi:hypothetical protein
MQKILNLFSQTQTYGNYFAGLGSGTVEHIYRYLSRSGKNNIDPNGILSSTLHMRRDLGCREKYDGSRIRENENNKSEDKMFVPGINKI